MLRTLIAFSLFFCWETTCSFGQAVPSRSSASVGERSNNSNGHKANGQSLLISDKDAQSWLENLFKLTRSGRSDQLGAHFDDERMFQLVERTNILDLSNKQIRSSLKFALKGLVATSFTDDVKSGGWIHPILVDHNRDVDGEYFIVNMLSESSRILGRLQIWVAIGEENQLRIIDWYDLDSFIRSSTMFATVGQGFLTEDTFAIRSILLAASLASQSNEVQAIPVLENLEFLALPTELTLVSELVKTRISLSLNDIESARESVQTIRKINPSHARLPEFELELLFLSGDFDSVIKLVRSSKMLESSPFGLTILGLALCKTDANVEGVKRIQDALAIAPSFSPAHLSIADISESVELAEIQKCLDICEFDSASFELLASTLAANDATLVLELLLDRAEKIGLERNYLTPYAAVVATNKGDHSTASKMYAELIRNQTSNSLVVTYQTNFLRSAALAGEHISAYRAGFVSSSTAFEVLAQTLFEERKFDELTELIELHKSQKNADPLIRFYQAQIFVEEGKLMDAAKILAVAVAESVDPSMSSDFKALRVNALCKAGEWRLAYETTVPHREVFTQIAENLFLESDFEAIAELVALHREKDPSDLEADLVAAKRFTLLNRHSEAAELLGSAYQSMTPGPRKTEVLQLCLSAYLNAGAPNKAYEIAEEKLAVFEYLASELLNENETLQVRKLCDLHEQQFSETIQTLRFRGLSYLSEGNHENAATSFLKGFEIANNSADKELFLQAASVSFVKSEQYQLAYESLNPKSTVFPLLAELLFDENRISDLEKLTKLYASNNPNDPYLLFWSAEVAMQKKDYSAATEQYQDVVQNLAAEPALQGLAESKFYVAAALNGRARDVYENSDHSDRTFEMLSQTLLDDSQWENLLELIRAHQSNQKDSLISLFYLGRLYESQMEFQKAIEVFSEGYNLSSTPELKSAFEDLIVDTAFSAGQSVSVFKNQLFSVPIFHQIASKFAIQRDAKGLTELIAAFKEDASISNQSEALIWEAEALWVNEQYAECANHLLKNRSPILSDSLNIDRFEDRLIRSLIRSDQAKLALEHAEESTDRDNDPWFEMLVFAALKDDGKAKEKGRFCYSLGYKSEDFSKDEDLMNSLGSEKIEEFVNSLIGSKSD